ARPDWADVVARLDFKGPWPAVRFHTPTRDAVLFFDLLYPCDSRNAVRKAEGVVESPGGIFLPVFGVGQHADLLAVLVAKGDGRKLVAERKAHLYLDVRVRFDAPPFKQRELEESHRFFCQCDFF